MEHAQARYDKFVSVHIGYDEALAHRLQAGSDILLAPARFEPCGLTQLYALRYGTYPSSAGRADWQTPLWMPPPPLSQTEARPDLFSRTLTLAGLIAALGRALALYREPLTWRRLQLQAMAQDFSWNASAAQYVSLYHDAMAMPLPSSGTAPIDDADEEIETRIAM